jgi:hypothetical protein
MCFTGFQGLTFEVLKDTKSLSSDDKGIEEYSLDLRELA